MQEELLTFQLGSFTNSVLNDWWNLEKLNAQKLKEIDKDHLQNSIFVRGNPNRPRLLVVDLKNNFEKYKFFRTSEPQKKPDLKMPTMWDNQKVTVFNINPEEKKSGEESLEEAKEHLAYAQFELNHHNFLRLPAVDNYFNAFVNGQEIVDKVETADEMEDKVRFYLEESDNMGGFQFFYDINSGYGPIIKYLQNYLRDECAKKPIMSYGFENEFYDTSEDTKVISSINRMMNKILGGMKVMNKLLTGWELMEGSSLYFQLPPSQLERFAYFDKKYIQKDPKNILQLYSYIISNLVFPCVATDARSWNNTLKGYTDILTNNPRRNFMNACFHIQGFPQNMVEDQTVSKDILNSIFNYKEYTPFTIYPLPDKVKLKECQTYGEDFTIRGDIVPHPKVFDELRFNFHIAHFSAWADDNATRLLSDEVVNKLGILQEEHQTLKIERLPLHSAIFSNSCFADYFKAWLDEYKGVPNISKLQFRKDNIIKDDDLKEMEHFYLDLRDVYDAEPEDVIVDDN